MNYNNNFIDTLSNFEDDSLGELFINEEGLIKEDLQDAKLSSIYSRLFNDETHADDLMNNFSMELLDSILTDDFEFGILSSSDRIFDAYHEKYGIVAVNWLVKLFISNLFNLNIVLGVILIISRQKIGDIGYQGQMILLTASFKFKEDLQIQDAIIRCIENWESYELVTILNQLHPKEKWLEDYKLSVINELQSACPTT